MDTLKDGTIIYQLSNPTDTWIFQTDTGVFVYRGIASDGHILSNSIKGERYDQVTDSLKTINDRTQMQLDECDIQQEELSDVIVAQKVYSDDLEKEVVRGRRRLRLMKVFAYCGAGASAVLTVLLILK